MMFLFTLLCLAVTAFLHSSALEDAIAPGERELRKDLFQDYDKYARPVKHHTTAVPVNVSLAPVSVKFLSEEIQQISLESWVRLAWVDEYLTWNPADYDNITLINVSPSEVWRPDVSVYTASPDTSLFPTVHTKAILYNSGAILWVPPFTINSRCPIALSPVTSPKAFIECNIRMGSWTYSGKLLDLQLGTDKVVLKDFNDINREWKLVKVDSDRESRLYPCCPDEYPFVDFNITLKRRN